MSLMQNLDQIMRLLDRYNQRNVMNGIVVSSVTVPIPPNITLEETLNIIQQEPEEVAEIIKEELAIGPIEGVVGDNLVPSEIDALMHEYHFQPSQINVQNKDYRRIKEYFKGTKDFNELTLDQRTLVESLRYTEIEDFGAIKVVGGKQVGKFQFK